jgi:hypothetical protein
LLWQAYLGILVQKKERLEMEISFVLDVASVLIGFVLGLVSFFAVALAVSYRMKKTELSKVYGKKK